MWPGTQKYLFILFIQQKRVNTGIITVLRMEKNEFGVPVEYSNE